MGQTIVCNSLMQMWQDERIDLFFESTLYYEKREIKGVQKKLDDVTRFGKFNRIYWYNGDENGLGLFCLTDYDEKEESNHLTVNVRYAVIYKRGNILKVIALVNIKEKEISSYQMFQHNSVKKKNCRIEYNKFFITPNSSLMGFSANKKIIDEYLTIPLTCVIVRRRFAEPELDPFNIKETIVKQLSKISIYYAVKNNVFFNSKNSILSNLSKKNSSNLFTQLLWKFISGIILFSYVFFCLYMHIHKVMPKFSTAGIDGIFINTPIFDNVLFLKIINTSIENFFLDNARISHYLLFLSENEVFAGLIGSNLFLFLTIKFLDKLKAERIFYENKFISEFLSKKYPATGFLFPFGCMLYVKSSLFGGLMNLRLFNERMSSRLDKFLNDKIGRSFDNEINVNNLQEVFGQHFSLSGIFEKFKNSVGKQ